MQLGITTSTLVLDFVGKEEVIEHTFVSTKAVGKCRLYPMLVFACINQSNNPISYIVSKIYIYNQSINPSINRSINQSINQSNF